MLRMRQEGREMILHIGNEEPDGRMAIRDDQGNLILMIYTDAIDEFARFIYQQCGSEGNGCSFAFNTFNGEADPL